MARDLDIGGLAKSFSSLTVNNGPSRISKETMFLSQLKIRVGFETSLRVKGTGDIQTQTFPLLLPKTTVLWCVKDKKEQNLRIEQYSLHPGLQIKTMVHFIHS